MDSALCSWQRASLYGGPGDGSSVELPPQGSVDSCRRGVTTTVLLRPLSSGTQDNYHSGRGSCQLMLVKVLVLVLVVVTATTAQGDYSTECGTPFSGSCIKNNSPVFHVAVNISKHVSDGFNIILEKDNKMKETIQFNVIDAQGMNSSMRLFLLTSDADHTGGSFPFYAVLPTNVWIHISLSWQERSLRTTLQYTSNETPKKSILTTTVFQVNVVACDDEITFKVCNDSQAIWNDAKCIENHLSLPEACSTAVNSECDSSGKGCSSAVTSSDVIWIVSICGALVIIVSALFVLWLWQHKKLNQRRISYQHSIIDRQQNRQNRQQFNQHSQSDTERSRELQPMQIEMKKVLSARQKKRKTVPSGSSRTVEPRSFIRPSKKDKRISNLSNITATTMIDDNPNDQTSVHDGRTNDPNDRVLNGQSINPIGGSSDPHDRSRVAMYANIPTTSSESNSSNSPSLDDVGINGPYWFYSSRNPDPETALKVYKV